MADNPHQQELPDFVLIADGKYREYYQSLEPEQKVLIESQAKSRNLKTKQSANNFLATRIIESKNTITKGFHIPKYKGSELNEDHNDSVVSAMKMLN